MAKRVVWTETARNQRRGILEYWIKRNGNKNIVDGFLPHFEKESNIWRNLTIWVSLQISMIIELLPQDISVSFIKYSLTGL